MFKNTVLASSIIVSLAIFSALVAVVTLAFKALLPRYLQGQRSCVSER